MTATEKLRQLLVERGAEWVAPRENVTMWWGENDTYWEAQEVYDGELDLSMDMSGFTPEKAVKATLGRGTCRLEREPDSDRLWWCSNCRSYHEHASEFPWEYCPRCGAKVVG